MKEIRNKLEIGGFRPKNNVLIAPLAGITDKVFRDILRQMGAGLCFTEMVCAKALLYQNKKTHGIMDITGEEGDCGIQLFGADPYEMAEAAKMAEATGTPLIDINMGCPVPKVVHNREGAALLKDPVNALSIAEAVVKAVKIPVTVKLRKGFQGEDAGIALAKSLESVGIAGITIHGRDRVAYYSGNADWQAIARVKSAAAIPVLGNGDIFTGEDALDMVRETHCDGVVLARGVLGNPWLVKEVLAALTGAPTPKCPTSEDRIALAIYHLEEACRFYGEALGIRHMRKFLGWYLKGFCGAAKTRGKINKETEANEVIRLLKAISAENEGREIRTDRVPPEV